MAQDFDGESTSSLITHSTQPDTPGEARKRPLHARERQQSWKLEIEEPGDATAEQPASYKDYTRIPHPRRHRSTFRLWRPELIAVSFSLACVLAEVGFLRALDGKPYENWHIGRSEITPNTLLSVLTTLSRSGLLVYVAQGLSQLKWLYFQQRAHPLSDLQIFDDASRGPWGSIRLIWSLNLKALAACLGAVLTVLSLAIEPFTQQIIAPYSNLTSVHNESALLSATFMFTWPIPAVDPQVELLRFQTTMLEGIAEPAALTYYNCPSGACTWPEYSSLGLCSSCEDITHEATATCSDLSVKNSDLPANLTLCTYNTAPDDGINDVSWTVWSPEPAYGKDAWLPTTWWNVTVDAIDDDSTALANITTVYFDDENDYNSSSADAPHLFRPTITRCSFNWCARKYASSYVDNGTLHDPATSSTPLAMASSNCSFNRAQQVYLCAARTAPQRISAFQAQQWTSNPKLAPKDTYFINTAYTENLGDIFTDVFDYTYNSSGGTGFEGSLPNITQRQEDSLMKLIPSTENTLGDPAGWAQAIFMENIRTRNISASLENIAISLTNLLRQGPNSTSVQGTVQRPIVFIRIRWPWFVYIALLSVFSILFLALVVTISYRPGQLVWKASSLALACHGLRSSDDFEMGVLETDDMYDLAKAQSVKLTTDRAGRTALRSS